MREHRPASGRAALAWAGTGAAVIAALAVAACGGQHAGSAGNRDEAPIVAPSAVAQLSVHPLSRVDCTGAPIASAAPARGGPPSAGCTLLLHLDLRDAAGDPVRTTGRLVVELDPPDGVAEPAADAVKSWAVDLSDPKQNVAMYDGVITHTYALRLAGLPPWLEAWAKSDDDRAPGPRVQVRLEADARSLTAERVLAR